MPKPFLGIKKLAHFNYINDILYLDGVVSADKIGNLVC